MPGIMEGTSKALIAEVEYSSKQGTELLQRGEKEKALGLFQLAHNKARQLKDAYTKRSCAFNLGAVYIALEHPDKGIKLLQQALPPPNKRDGKSNGDLFYNFGLGHEALRDYSEASKYYELALEEYQSEGDNVAMEAEVASKTGHSYTQANQHLFAARCHGIAATAYNKMNNVVEEANVRCRQATNLYQAQRVSEASTAADQCMIICQKISHGPTIGRLYNELGLTYTQCHEFAKAATCFELALPSSRGPSADRKQEAVIVQNLGAVYNSLGDYQRALQFHQKAAALHAQLGNRNSQGQCFANLAFAFSQLGEKESAGEYYLHALQAAKDTDDLHGQWQAMEGLGAVAFNDGDTDKAAMYFKQALATLRKCEDNKIAKERILTKLSDALGSEANSEVSMGSPVPVLGNVQTPINPVSVLVNDRPRPPSRQEVLQMQYLRQQREMNRDRLRARRDFLPIARGLGAYDEYSDSSISRSDFSIELPRRRKPHRHKIKDKRYQEGVSESELWDSRTRPTTARGTRTKRLIESVSEPELKTEPLVSPRYVSASEREMNVDKFAHRRRNPRTLLRKESHDSELEWRNHMREIKSDSSENELSAKQNVDAPDCYLRDDEYRERLRPPSRLSSRNGSWRKNRSKWSDVHHFRRAMRNLVRSALSDPDEPRRIKINRKKFAGDVGEGQPSPRSRSEKQDEPDALDDLEPEQKNRIEQMIDVMTNTIVEATNQITGKNKEKEEVGSEDTKKIKRRNETIEEENEEEDEEEESDEDAEEEEEEREAQMKAYEKELQEKRLRKMKNDDELNSSIPVIPAPPVPLGSTYEIPVSSEPPPGENFFRSEDGMVVGKESSRATGYLPGCGRVAVDDSATTPRPDKHVENEDEPLYQTIRSLKSTQPEPHPHSSSSNSPPGEAPALPPRTSEMPNEEKNELLDKYEEDRNANYQQRRTSMSNETNEVSAPTQVKEERKNSSRTCVVM